MLPFSGIVAALNALHVEINLAKIVFRDHMQTCMSNGNGDIRNHDKRSKRIKLVKKLLRRVPRRASLHKYPVLRKFADVARRKPYLWSFRVSDVTPAFYFGWIIMLTPLPAVVHLIMAFFMALISQSNLTILLLLPLLSNTVTFLFWWAITYKVGQWAILILGAEKLPPITFTVEGIRSLRHCSTMAINFFGTITLGAIILGPLFGALSSAIYKYFAQRYSQDKRVRS